MAGGTVTLPSVLVLLATVLPPARPPAVPVPVPTLGLPGGVTVLSVSGSQGEEEPEENPSKEEKQEPGTPMRKAGRPGRKRKHAQVSQRAPGPGGWRWVNPRGAVLPWGCSAGRARPRAGLAAL